MADLHDDIMRLPHDLSDDMDIGERHAYRKGHRDARHAAAELATTAMAAKDARIAEAEAARREDYIETLHAERIGGVEPATIELVARSTALNIMAAWRDPAHVSAQMPGVIERIVAEAMRGLVAPQAISAGGVEVDIPAGADGVRVYDGRMKLVLDTTRTTITNPGAEDQGHG